MREQIAMSQYDEICDFAIANYGLVSTAQAADMGVARKDIGEWVKLGRLDRLGRGVYRIAHYYPTEYDQYALAVALVGEGSYIWGDSVLAMHNLALVNPLHVFVATNNRVRRTLPNWIKLVKMPKGARVEVFEGIPCQKLADVLREARGKILTERLQGAVEEAERKGLMKIHEIEDLRKELRR